MVRIRAALLLSGVAVGLYAQSFQGGVRGIVTDPGGAVVPNVKVVLIDQATSEQRATLSNSAGEYSFTSVNPATYTVRAEAPSFKKFEHLGVAVATQEFVTVDVKLQIGDTNLTVNVNEEVPLVETANADTGQVVDKQKLDDLPNMGRNPFYETVNSTAWKTRAARRRFRSMEDRSPGITTRSMALPSPTRQTRR